MVGVFVAPSLMLAALPHTHTSLDVNERQCFSIRLHFLVVGLGKYLNSTLNQTFI
jgi:hypothetical protein